MKTNDQLKQKIQKLLPLLESYNELKQTNDYINNMLKNGKNNGSHIQISFPFETKEEEECVIDIYKSTNQQKFIKYIDMFVKKELKKVEDDLNKLL